MSSDSDLDQKIQQAIQPLLARITALQQDNAKIRQELASLSTNPTKPAHKPTTLKTQADQNNGVKPPRKLSTDKIVEKKPPAKKEQGEESKPQAPKHVGLKSPVVATKAAPSPINNKEGDSKNAKDVKPRPNTALPAKTGTAVKSNPAEKKGTKPAQTETQKKQEKTEEKKGASHEKTQHKGPSAHIVKSPAVNKGPKPAQPKKVTAPAPVPGSAAKKGGKPVEVKKKQPEVKPASPEPKVQVQEQTGAENVQQKPKSPSSESPVEAPAQQVQQKVQEAQSASNQAVLEVSEVAQKENAQSSAVQTSNVSEVVEPKVQESS